MIVRFYGFLTLEFLLFWYLFVYPSPELELHFTDTGTKGFVIIQALILAIVLPTWSIAPLFNWYEKIKLHFRFAVSLGLALFTSQFGYDLIKISQKLYNFNLYNNGALNDILHTGNGWYIKAKTTKATYTKAVEDYIDDLNETSQETKQKLKENIDFISQTFHDEGGPSAMRHIAELKAKLTPVPTKIPESTHFLTKTWETVTYTVGQGIQWCQNHPMAAIGIAGGVASVIGIGYLFGSSLLSLIDKNREAITSLTDQSIRLSETSNVQAEALGAISTIVGDLPSIAGQAGINEITTLIQRVNNLETAVTQDGRALNIMTQSLQALQGVIWAQNQILIQQRFPIAGLPGKTLVTGAQIIAANNKLLEDISKFREIPNP